MSVRVPLPVRGSGAVVRNRTLSPNRSRKPLAVKRAIACFSCPLAGSGSRTAGQTWAPGGCGGGGLSASSGLEQRRASLLFLEGRPLPLSRLFLQELAKFFMSLSGSSSLGAPGVLAGVTASAAASGGNACPASTAAGAATFCAATVTPAGAGVLPAAPAAVPGVSGDQQRQGLSRSRGRRSRSSGDGPDRRAKSAPEEGLLLLTALRVVGGGAVALPQIRLRVTELTLLLPVPGMRLEVRILVALPGILTARLVLGRCGLLQGMSFASLERVVVRLDLRVWRMLSAPLPSRGFAWREVAWAAFQSPMASRFWAGFFHPLLGAPLLGRLSVVPTAWLTAVSLACGLAFAVFLDGGGLPRGY